MSAIDVEQLLAPCSESPPCGADLEYDDAFLAVFRAAQPRNTESMVGPAAESQIEWRPVRDQVNALFGRTKDLRLGVLLVRAGLQTEGLAGLNASLTVLVGLVERYWDAVHPMLTADEGFDPMMRLNALRELDSREVLTGIQSAPLASLQGVGSVCFRDVGGNETTDGVPVENIFVHCGLAELRDIAATVAGARAAAESLERTVTAQIQQRHGPGAGHLKLEALTEMLGRVEQFLATKIASRAGEDGAAAEGDDVQSDAGGPIVAVSGAIRSRADVVRVLDQICTYYERAEPASPVPILLKRAQRLVPMSFEEILQNLAPSALGEVKTIRGPEEN